MTSDIRPDLRPARAAWWATPRIRLVLRFAMLVGIGARDRDGRPPPDDGPARRRPRLLRRRRPAERRPAAVRPAGRHRRRGNDADFNRVGNHGYGAYGENVAIGNIDDDPQLEIIITFDNHQINAFNLDGTSVLASPWFTNRESARTSARGWAGGSSSAGPTRASRAPVPPPHRRVAEPGAPGVAAVDRLAAAVADLDGDGRNEVIGLPNVETNIPYRTQGYAFMVLDGAYGGGAARPDATAGSTNLPMSDHPAVPARRRLVPAERHPRPDGGRHRRRPPARDRLLGSRRRGLRGRARPASACGATSTPTAREDVRLRGRRRRPEQGRHTRAGLRHLRAPPRRRAPGRAVRRGQEALGHPPAPPGQRRQRHRRRRPLRRSPTSTATGAWRSSSRPSTTASTSTRVPGSGANCLPWPTGRGNLLRNGAGPATA